MIRKSNVAYLTTEGIEATGARFRCVRSLESPVRQLPCTFGDPLYVHQVA